MISKDYIRDHVISSEEVREILGRSRQWVAANTEGDGKSKNDLNPIRIKTMLQSHRLNLYLLEDIILFKQQRKMLRPRAFKADELDGEVVDYKVTRKVSRDELQSLPQDDPNKDLREEIMKQIWLTGDVELFLGISRQQIGRAVENGWLPIIKITSKVKLFYKEDVIDYWEKHYASKNYTLSPAAKELLKRCA
jgi:hypothetical protein